MAKDYDFYVSSGIDINNINSDRVPNYKEGKKEKTEDKNKINYF